MGYLMSYLQFTYVASHLVWVSSVCKWHDLCEYSCVSTVAKWQLNAYNLEYTHSLWEATWIIANIAATKSTYAQLSFVFGQQYHVFECYWSSSARCHFYAFLIDPVWKGAL